GASWDTTRPFGANVPIISDMQFLNPDTGWFTCNLPLGGGLFNTTNGGNSWTVQLNQTFRPNRVHFINGDTGWVAATDGRLFRTLNGGTNWGLQHTFPGNPQDIYFLNGLRGVASA